MTKDNMNQGSLEENSPDLEQALKYAEEFSDLYHSEKIKRKALEIANTQLKDFSKTLESTYKELHSVYLSALRCLSLAAEYKDDETGSHIHRVSSYSQILARKLGSSDETIKHLQYAAPMHDIGKVGIPDHIMQKNGVLSSEEFEIIKTHTTIGETILKGLKSPVTDLAKRIAISHHEKWDGSGYPNGLEGTNIPVEGRIVSLVDVFDALTSIRPYKSTYSFEKSCEIIRSESGKSFDPKLVNIFLESGDEFLKVMGKFSEKHQSPHSDSQLSERDL